MYTYSNTEYTTESSADIIIITGASLSEPHPNEKMPVLMYVCVCIYVGVSLSTSYSYDGQCTGHARLEPGLPVYRRTASERVSTKGRDWLC